MDAQQIMNDPEFHALPNNEKAKVLREVDPDFAGLPASEQGKVIMTLKAPVADIKGEPTALALENTGRAFHEETVKPSDPNSPSLIGNPTPADRDLSLLKQLGKTTLRTGLEGGGSVAGGLLAGAVTKNPWAVATGGATGYTTGKQIADLLLGENKVSTLPEAAMKIGQDFGTGALYEMGGAAIPAAAGALWREVKGVTPTVTQSGIQKAAGQSYNKMNTPNAPDFATNAAEADALEQIIPGMKFNPAQRTGAPSAARDFKLTQNNPVLQDIAETAKAGQRDTLESYLQRNITGSGTVDDLYRQLEGNAAQLDNSAAAARPQVTGGNRPYDTGKQIIDNLQTTEGPIKAAAEELYSKVPNDYPMQARNLRNAYSRIQGANDVPASVSDRIAGMLDRDKYTTTIKEGSSTVGAMRAIRSELKSLESELINKGDKASARYVKELQDAYKKDFAAFGERARSGEIVEIDGRLVNPGALGDKLANNQVKIAELKSQSSAGEIDYRAVEKAIQDKGGKISQPGVNFEQADADAANLADYKRRYGKDNIPMTAAKPANEKLVANYEARNAEISDMLQRAGQPVDAEAALLAADRFYATQYAPRFKNADVAGIRRAGNEASGLKAEYEAMPQRFANVSGAKNLKTAIGPDQAAETMRQHYLYDLAQTMERNPSGAASWVLKNREALKEYGLLGEFNSVAKQQSAYESALANKDAYTKSIAGKILGTDDVTQTIAKAANSGSPKRAFEELMTLAGNNTAAKDGIKTGLRDHIWGEMQNAARDAAGKNLLSDAKAQQVLKQYRPAMESIYSKQEMQAFDNVAAAIKVMNRDKVTVAGGGSGTSQNLADMGRGFIANSAGIVGRVAVGLSKVMPGIGKDEINELIIRASYDPAIAKQIQDAAKGKDWTRAIRNVTKTVLIGGTNLIKQGLQQPDE